jgi:hypothetical protein
MVLWLRMWCSYKRELPIAFVGLGSPMTASQSVLHTLQSLEVIPTASFTWRSKAPLQCRFFAWLAIKNRCWTSEHLAKRGLPHQSACPFCDQHQESIDHILLACVFVRTVWMTVCTSWGRQDWTHTPNGKLQQWCVNKEGGRTGEKMAEQFQS